MRRHPRAGGRAFTQKAGPYPLDHGCGWLHSADRNAWRPLAEAAGFTINRALPQWDKQAFDLGFTPQEQSAFAEASDSFNQKISDSAQSRHDQPAAHLLDPGCRWNPLLEAVSTYMSGAELEHISVLDIARYSDSEINWRIEEGYGSAITTLGGALPISFNCAVKLIDHSGIPLRVETQMGALTARAVIITVPPTLLLSGALRFHPELPRKKEAAEALPLGVANKLFMTIDDADDLPVDGHLFGRFDRTETASYHLRPFGRPLIEAYFGGALAHGLEQTGATSFFTFACDELAFLFGNAIRKRLHFAAATSWAENPLSLGSYSYARPGHADARQSLAQSIDNRLFFAGEACSGHFFSTAHGAYETGVAAAEQALSGMLNPTASKTL